MKIYRNIYTIILASLALFEQDVSHRLIGEITAVMGTERIIVSGRRFGETLNFVKANLRTYGMQKVSVIVVIHNLG